MCLSPLHPVSIPKRQFGRGWKVFRRSRGKLYSLVIDKLTVRKRKQWLVADKIDVAGVSPLDRGWHIYVHKRDIKSLQRGRVILPVRYRGAFAVGKGDGGWNVNAVVVVANELYIL